jgi:Dolichyl-phosphate-mannose-protein mannosyltransferase
MRIALGTRLAQATQPTPPSAADREKRPAGFAPASRFAGGHEWLVLGLVWLSSAIYVGGCLKRGWLPWDAGLLAQSAERVLQGQVPFRDFGEVFTGGLSYLNAFAFRLFGVNLLSIRIPLFILFLGWVPVIYFIARRFAGPLAAGLVTLLAVAWSLPNYTEAMPSWYNLFFATFGAAALLRYIDTRRQRWLWAAGMCGGLSIVVKITGLYFIAAGLLFFAFREQALNAQAASASRKRGLFYRPFVIACLLLFLAILFEFLWEQPSLAGLVDFVLPGASVAALLLWHECQRPAGPDGARFRSLFSMALPFLAGAAVPVGILFLWYAHAGALHDFLRVTARLSIARQVRWAAAEPISPLAAIGLAPAVAIFLLARSADDGLRRLGDRMAPVMFAVLLLAARKFISVYELVGFSAPLVIPLLAVAALVWLRPRSVGPQAEREEVFLLLSVAVLCALIAFPFAHPDYFCYVAPLVILALLALVSLRPVTGAGRVAMGSLAGFYLVFALWLYPPGFRFVNGIGGRRNLQMQALPFARAGGIRVAPEQAEEYGKLIPLIQAHARGPFIYAAPDCPEVYFLSGLRNPTPTLFEFLDPDFLDIPARTERILSTIQSHGVNVVALGDKSWGSAPLPAGLRAALDSEFPESARVGDFEVRWKP